MSSFEDLLAIIKDLRSQNENLRSQNEDLRSQNEDLRSQNEILKKEKNRILIEFTFLNKSLFKCHAQLKKVLTKIDSIYYEYYDIRGFYLYLTLDCYNDPIPPASIEYNDILRGTHFGPYYIDQDTNSEDYVFYQNHFLPNPDISLDNRIDDTKVEQTSDPYIRYEFVPKFLGHIPNETPYVMYLCQIQEVPDNYERRMMKEG